MLPLSLFLLFGIGSVAGSSARWVSFEEIGNENLNGPGNQAFGVPGMSGVEVEMRGWSHTRAYNKGFKCNVNCGSGRPIARFSGLAAGAEYEYQIVQFDTSKYCKDKDVQLYVNNLLIQGTPNYFLKEVSLGYRS